jgi:hypothetical protein
MAIRKSNSSTPRSTTSRVPKHAATPASSVPSRERQAVATIAETSALAELEAKFEARITALESANANRQAANTSHGAAKLTADDDRFWALNELNRQHAAAPDDRGIVLYTGTVVLPSGAQYVWQRQDTTRELLKQDWNDLADTIAALGHPMRLAILKYALGEERTTQDFMSLPDMGTTGQLFHHIKALQDAGWLRSLQRGRYGVPGERVVPLLAILAATRG